MTVTIRGSDGRIERLTTKRLIKAYGNHVLPSSPLPVSSAAVRSTTPEELTGMIAKHAADSGPVRIIGSGKTAMDVALMLRRECPGRELNMVAGSNTMFSRRETFFPTGPRRWYGGTRINAMLREVALRFDGTNEHDPAAWFADAYGISAHERRTWRRQSRFRATRAHHAGTDARPAWRGKQGSDGAVPSVGPESISSGTTTMPLLRRRPARGELHVGFESRPAIREGRLPQRWR